MIAAYLVVALALAMIEVPALDVRALRRDDRPDRFAADARGRMAGDARDATLTASLGRRLVHAGRNHRRIRRRALAARLGRVALTRNGHAVAAFLVEIVSGWWWLVVVFAIARWLAPRQLGYAAAAGILGYAVSAAIW